MAPSTEGDAPYEDPEWECWGLPWHKVRWAYFDRLFEMHDRALWESPQSNRENEYLEKLQDLWVPVYMQEKEMDIPQSVAYPFETLRGTFWRGFPRWDQEDWYNSSLSYAMVMAIDEGADEIGLWGIDMSSRHAEGEYRYQLPNMDYLIGRAEGAGIKVTIPQGPTELLKFEGEGIRMGKMMPSYPKRYGRLANGNL